MRALVRLVRAPIGAHQRITWKWCVMPDPSWKSVSTGTARYCNRARRWREDGGTDADERHALAVESWRLDEATLYLHTSDIGESLTAWRARALAGEVDGQGWADVVLQRYREGHPTRPQRRRTKTKPNQLSLDAAAAGGNTSGSSD